MKKLILSLLFLGFISTAQTQILLDEARVDYSPISMKLDPGTNMLVYTLQEKSAGEFHRDPLAFAKKEFNSIQFVQENQDANLDFYKVKFKSSKGHLTAHYNKRGELVSSYQIFKNVVIPEEARLQIIEKYKGCSFLKSSYAATSKGWELKKQHYRVQIKDGDKVHRIKIDKDEQGLTLAGL